MNLCKCGCGAEVKKEYAKGHYSRVFNPTRDNPEIAKRAIANAHKVRHAGLKDGTQKIWNQGLTKETDKRVAHNNDHSRGKKMEEYIADPERLKVIKEKFSNMAKNRTPEHKQKIKEGLVEYWSDEEKREKQRENHTNWLEANNWKMKTSRAEKLYESILIKHNISYVKQFRLKNKLFDFKIGNTIIEIDGDFYHCNPINFPNGAKYPIQIKTLQNDELKNNIVKSSEFNLKRIWYSELLLAIKENREAELLP